MTVLVMCVRVMRVPVLDLGVVVRMAGPIFTGRTGREPENLEN